MNLHTHTHTDVFKSKLVITPAITTIVLIVAHRAGKQRECAVRYSSKEKDPQPSQVGQLESGRAAHYLGQMNTT